MSDSAPPPLRADLGDPLIGVVLAGRFEILAPLGAGAAAKVYRAIQQPMGRQVALKVIRPDLDEARQATFETRFLREAAQTGRLSHPNLVTVFDYGRAEDGSCFLAMELLQGSTLKRALDGTPMDTLRAVRIVLGITLGLRHAHRRGMVHRDVKPGNVFLVRDDEDHEVAKLLDFGLVKADEDPTITRSGAFMGTPHYIAPEQARGQSNIDGRADLYSLGCIFYRLLTGVLPYEAENPMAIALKHLRDPYPPMAQRAPGVNVDPALEAMVRRCMAKDPKDRYADAGELARALQTWLGEAPVEDQESSTLAPAALVQDLDARPPKRSMGLVAALGLLFGVGGGLLLWLAAAPDPQAVAPVVAEVAASAQADPGSGAGALPTAPTEALPTEALPTEGAPTEATPTEATPTEAAPTAPKKSSGDSSGGDKAPKTSTTRSPGSDPPKASPSGGLVVADGVRMDAATAERALRFANTGDDAALRAAGLRTQQVNILLGGRPFGSMQALADTPYIGEKTIEALIAHAP